MIDSISTLSRLLESGAATATAISAPGGAPLSYERLRALVAETVTALSAQGIGPNDRVAIVLDNGPEMAAAFLSIGTAATAAPLNPSYRAEEFEFYLTDLRAKLLVVARDKTSPVIDVAAKLGVPVARLKHEARELEFRQQTSVLTPSEEKALVDQLARLQAEIRKREKELEQDEEVRTLADELHAAKDTAEAAHKNVGELAEAAQAEHDQMVALFEQGDALRTEADTAQEEFIRTKMTADEEHKKHIEFIRQVHDYDKIIHGIRLRGRKAEPGEGEAVDVKRQAEMIFEKFRKGEKLSTEDLMVLQKSGYM